MCYTLNNYTEGEEIALWEMDSTYHVIGHEVGEGGTPHLQGYVEFGGQRTFASLKKAFPRIHMEARKGTPQQAADYCKKDGDFREKGKLSRPGERSDLLALHALASTCTSDYDMYEQLPSTMLRYHRNAAHCRLTYARKRFNKWKPVEVHIRWGAAGTHKTRYVYENYEDVYSVPFSKRGTVWFDGVEPTTTTILLDDFYGELEWSLLLKLLDGYPFSLPVKGGFTWKNYDRVFITSNKSPLTWYAEGFPPEFQRRITTLTHLHPDGTSDVSYPSKELEESRKVAGKYYPATSESSEPPAKKAKNSDDSVPTPTWVKVAQAQL